jgi:two-component system cell cycle sensor histidine kinase/response regulator CckA
LHASFWIGLVIDLASAYVTVLVLLAGVFTAGLIIHAFAARHHDRRWDHVALAIVCASVASYLVLEVQLYGSHVVAEHATIRRWEQVAVAPFSIVFPLYLATIAGFSRRVVAAISVPASLIAVLVAWHSSCGLWLANIDHLQEFRLPWGEVLMLARGPASAWMYYSLGIWLAISCLGIWSALRYRRDPSAVGVTALLCGSIFFFLSLIHDSLLDGGIIRGVFLSEFVAPFLAGAMWWRMAVDHRRRGESWRHLFTRTGDALFVHDLASGILVEVNDAACAVLGRTRQEIIMGGMALVLTDPGDHAAYLSRTSSPMNLAPLVERSCQRRDGSSFPAEIALRTATLEGRVQLIASLRDLTQRRQAELAVVENEIRLRQVIERCPIPVVESDGNGRALSFNPSFSRLFGYTVEDLDSYEAWARMTQPNATIRDEILGGWRAALAHARASGGVIPSFRIAMSDHGGHMRQVDICCVQVGERMVTFFTDLNDILVARDALAEQEALQRTIIEESSDGVSVLSWSGAQPAPTVQVWNRRMGEILGLIAPIGEDLVDPDLEGMLGLLRSGEPCNDREFALERQGAATRRCLLTTSLLPSSDDGRWMLLMVRDITQQRRAEEERRQIESQAQRTQQLESLGVLAGGIAHDFNNLLMSILGRAGLVRAMVKADDAKSAIDLQEMEEAARRAAMLCQQLLAYAGKGGAQVGPLELSGLVQGMQAILGVTVSKQVTLSSDTPTPVTINADGDQIHQVILNLVVNASEAIAERQGSISIQVGIDELTRAHESATGVVPPGHYAVLQVVDSGPGMDAQTLRRVYEPFFSTKFTGRGLGLAVVLGIVRSHRGGIDITSQPGLGTSVRILLPALEQPVGPAAGISGPEAAAATVLVIDDEPSIRSITCEMLVHLGYAVMEAGSAKEAYAVYASERRPEVVILDLTLPDGSGADILMHLQRVDPQARVIVASGYGRDDIVRFLGAGQPSGILTKPFDLETLATAVNAARPPAGAGL